MEPHPLSSTPPAPNDVVTSPSLSDGFSSGPRPEAPSGTPLTREIDHSQSGSLLPSSMKPSPAAAAGGQPRRPPVMVSSQLVRASRMGATWFYYVCGLTLVNTALEVFNAGIRFGGGLETAHIINEIAYVMGRSASSHGAMLDQLVGASLSLPLMGLFAFFGTMATKGKSWAFLTGGVLLVLDGLLFLIDDPTSHPIGILIHGLAIYNIFTGWQANIKLQKQIQAAKAVGSSPWTG